MKANQEPRFAILVLLLALFSVSCGGEDSTPEGQIRAGVDSAVKAAKDRDVLGVRSFISESYRDDRDQGKDALGLLLSAHLKRSTILHIFHKVKSLEVDPSGTAEGLSWWRSGPWRFWGWRVSSR